MFEIILDLKVVGSSIVDVSSKSHAITARTGAVVSSTGSKYGDGHIEFDGGSDSGIHFPATDDFKFNQTDGDFTVELWFKEDPGSTSDFLVGWWDYPVPPTAYDLQWFLAAGGDSETAAIGFNVREADGGYGANLGYISGAYEVGEWTHVAVCRKGKVLYFFHNGTLFSTKKLDRTILDPTGGKISIGAPDAADLTSASFIGAINGVRITRGAALYLHDFVLTGNGYELDSTATPYHRPDLLHEWDFDADQGTAAIDFIGGLPIELQDNITVGVSGLTAHTGKAIFQNSATDGLGLGLEPYGAVKALDVFFEPEAANGFWFGPVTLYVSDDVRLTISIDPTNGDLNLYVQETPSSIVIPFLLTADIPSGPIHVVVQWSAANGLEIYANGVLEYEDSDLHDIFDYVSGGTAVLGTYSTAYTDGVINCTVDELRLYSGALSQEDVTNRYAYLTTGVIDPKDVNPLGEPGSVTVFSIEGTVLLSADPEAEPAQATLRLYEAVTGEFREETQSDLATGYYKFETTEESDTPEVDLGAMRDGESYFVQCHYGTGIRPLVHGPIVPIIETTGVVVEPEPELTDPLWDYVTVFLTFGEDLSDASSYAQPVVETGSVVVGTTEAKYYTKSAYFDGTASQLTIAHSQDIDIEWGDITLECWAFLASLAENKMLAHWKGDGSDYGDSYALWFDGGTDTLRFTVWNTAKEVVIDLNAAGGSFILNEWRHIAVTIAGSTAYLFDNGVLLDSAVMSERPSCNRDLTIGANTDDTRTLEGYLSELRLTRGVARYTEAFTPPTSQFLTSSAGVTDADPYWSNVVLSLPLSQHAADLSDFTQLASAQGGVTVSSGNTLFSESTLRMDGVDDCLLITNSEEVLISNRDYTIEFHVYLDALPGDTKGFFGLYDVTNNQRSYALGLVYEDSEYQLRWSQCPTVTTATVNDIVVSGSVAAQTWMHIALVSHGGLVSFFIDGVLMGSCESVACADSTGVLGIGTFVSEPPGALFAGNIANFRMTMDVARYGGAFTPPSAAYPVTGNTKTGDLYWDSALMLLRPGVSLTDLGLRGKSFTVEAGALTTGAARNAYASAVFDGSTYLHGSTYIPATGNWTLEMWLMMDAVTADTSIFSQYHEGVEPAAEGRLMLSLNSDNKYRLFIGHTAGNIILTAPSVMPSDEWTNLVLQRAGDDFSMYLNGVRVATATQAGITINTLNDTTICKGLAGYPNASGKIDSVRFTRYIAKYHAEGFIVTDADYPAYQEGGSMPIVAPSILFTMDSVSGSTLTNEGSSGVNGTLYNAPSFVAGKDGNCLVTDGVSQYARLGRNFQQSTQSHTISLWFKATRDLNRFLDGYYQSSPSQRMYYHLGTNGVKFIYGELSTLLWSVPLTGWHHVVGSYDHTTAILTCYLDSLCIGQLDISGDNRDFVLEPFLGCMGNASQQPSSDYHECYADTLRVYDYPVTAQEVVGLYHEFD